MKNKKQIIIIIALVLITLITSVFYFKQENSVSKTSDIYGGYEEYSKSKKEQEAASMERNYEKEFYCSFENNVGNTECLIKNLDRLATIREWKQKKLENIKYPEIGSELLSYLDGDSLKIKKWRENFENARDLKCNASFLYRYGSGSPGSIASCSIEEEISALKILDKNYYRVIMNDFDGSKGIPDFEPTEQDVQKLMETNKTTRENCCGGIW